MEIASNPIEHPGMIPASLRVSKVRTLSSEGTVTCSRSQRLWEQELGLRTPGSQAHAFSPPSHTLNGQIQSNNELSQPVISRPVALHRGKGEGGGVAELSITHLQAQKLWLVWWMRAQPFQKGRLEFDSRLCDTGPVNLSGAPRILICKLWLMALTSYPREDYGRQWV